MLNTLIDQPLNLTTSDNVFQEAYALWSFLNEQGTFTFPMLDSGLFSAACLTEDGEYTGYHNVWVRDNVHIAYAHFVTGRTDVACKCVEALFSYFQKHAHRFEAIIGGTADASDPMNRPHIRFNGNTLEENDETWSHAQNDALGYFLWIYCKLANAGYLTPKPEDWNVLGLFPLYFSKVQFWQDEDSGHWEESRKVEASSIGVVVAALRELRTLLSAQAEPGFCCAGKLVSVGLLDVLSHEGRTALASILPHECVSEDSAKARRYDSSLLFLIYPLEVVEGEMAEQIVHDVESQLMGDYGVRRYLGDSFWCANYKTLQSPELRTADVSSDMSARDSLLQAGQEAQWCIFDPILSVIYGRRYAATRLQAHLDKQIFHLKRSIAQLTKNSDAFPAYLCPELYYLDGANYGPNDVTPLLWTQANLMTALNMMQNTARLDHEAVIV